MKSCVFTVVASKNIFLLFRDRAGGRTAMIHVRCPPPTKRPSFHRCAPIPLLGSPWQQSNERVAKRSTGGEHITPSRKWQLLPVRLVSFLFRKGAEQIMWPTLSTPSWGMVCFLCFSFVYSSVLFFLFFFTVYSCAAQL